uniref:Uncharacterized protein n=1 Tax=Trypanosoma vivax (strain Y486) TaxID=1055687 RepID=G0TS94_TRYVY|nr:hypothetical protein, unlikely [Trypanosoma vivax Y486]
MFTKISSLLFFSFIYKTFFTSASSVTARCACPFFFLFPFFCQKKVANSTAMLARLFLSFSFLLSFLLFSFLFSVLFFFVGCLNKRGKKEGKDEYTNLLDLFVLLFTFYIKHGLPHLSHVGNQNVAVRFGSPYFSSICFLPKKHLPKGLF